ncbi:MAG: cation:proton antiporter regulatory subunit [Acidimicrobiia bacterium]
MTTPTPRLGLSLAAVTEQSMPGIGHRFDLPADDGAAVVVVLHHSGRRDLYVVAAGNDEPRASVTLSDSQARTLGAILAGAYFKPAIAEEIEAVVGGLLIDWVTLRADSPGAGQSIAALAIRRRTGMTVAAILRDHQATVAPEPTEVLHPGDQLVILGRREDLAGFVHHVVG